MGTTDSRNVFLCPLGLGMFTISRGQYQILPSSSTNTHSCVRSGGILHQHRETNKPKPSHTLVCWWWFPKCLLSQKMWGLDHSNSPWNFCIKCNCITFGLTTGTLYVFKLHSLILCYIKYWVYVIHPSTESSVYGHIWLPSDFTVNPSTLSLKEIPLVIQAFSSCWWCWEAC